MPYFVGVDLGATNVRAAVADGDATIVASDKRPTPRGPTGIQVTEAVLDTIRAACESAGVAPGDVAAAGIGSIGPLDLADGVVNGPANLPDSVGTVPLVGPVSKLVDTGDVYLHNDTVAGVIGERYHADRNPDDMAYVTISSGIGAGVAVDGNVLTGWDGNAGELGHMVVDPQGRRTCGCGRDGHWEAYCSGENIPEYAQMLAADGDVDTALPLEDAEFSAKHVFEHADDDEFAAYVVDQVGFWNAVGITNLVQAYAPLVVYVGGAVALNNPEKVLDPVREHLDTAVFNNVPELRLTSLGDDVVLRGAVASALTGGTGDRSRS
ncbi:ROK family protein [Halobacterium bonnevillei]|uniref:ROK family protein n=1 Tax=Halobacterium bonnevillei TaxID=2692200 RepID=A0A6B0SS76_9EURY|nr:ROK family protein [Halobacterium bonnevillei]MXR21872.1 ROK family protein [Halobacterium bonnevillei]